MPRARPEQKAVIEENQHKRAEIQNQIGELSKKRAAHIKAEATKSGAPAKDAFDSEVASIVRDKGEKVGLTY